MAVRSCELPPPHSDTRLMLSMQLSKTWKKMRVQTNCYATWITTPCRRDLPLSSAIPTENDWFQPDKEEFQLCGQESGAEITLQVDVVFEFPPIRTSRWLQGFAVTANNAGLCIKNKSLQRGGREMFAGFVVLVDGGLSATIKTLSFYFISWPY